jgi:hypothetical protein
MRVSGAGQFGGVSKSHEFAELLCGDGSGWAMELKSQASATLVARPNDRLTMTDVRSNLRDI